MEKKILLIKELYTTPGETFWSVCVPVCIGMCVLLYVVQRIIIAIIE